VKPDFDNNPKVFKTKDIFITVPKLVTKFVSNNIEFALDEIGYYNTNVVYNVQVKKDINIYFLLGILNSSVVNFCFCIVYINEDAVFPHIQKNQLESIPLPQIDLSKTSDKVILDKVVHAASQLLDLYPKVATAVLAERQRIEGKIAHFENEINRIVYKLYGLDDNKDIAIIEGNT
jgi:hypothetical protein